MLQSQRISRKLIIQWEIVVKERSKRSIIDWMHQKCTTYMELWSVHYCANINRWPIYIYLKQIAIQMILKLRKRRKKALNFWHFFYFTQFTSFNAIFLLIRSLALSLSLPLLVRTYIIQYLHKISYYFPPRNDRSHFFRNFSSLLTFFSFALYRSIVVFDFEIP